MEAIQRELDILVVDLESGSVPHRLGELLQDLDTRFGAIGGPARAELRAAAERGEERVDLSLEVPRELAIAARHLSRMLDEVDEFCRSGDHLLTLAAPPDLASFRSWFLDEIARQIEQGKPPSTWSPPVTPAGAEPPHSSGHASSPHIERVRFEGDLDLATAAALREQLITARGDGASEVIVDLTAVGFIDSVGLGLLISAHRRLAEDGLGLRILVPEKLRLLFDIAGLTEVLQPEFVAVDPGLTA
jgi:anti-anti-sigma factor